MIYQSDASAPEEVEVHKKRRDTYYVISSLSSSTGESICDTMEIGRASCSPPIKPVSPISEDKEVV